MAQRTNLQVVLGITLTILSLAVLSVSIATLVKVYKKSDDIYISSTSSPSEVSSKPQRISKDDTKYSGFSDALNRLKLLMDLNADPCDDFYQFTCGNYKGRVSFDTRQEDDFKIMTKFAENPATKKLYANVKPMSQMLIYYEKCKNTNPQTSNVSYVDGILTEFNYETHIGFPTLDGTHWVFNKDQFSKAVGYLYGRLNIATFLTPYVDTNWKRPDTGYKLLFDQPSLYFGSNYYLKAWNQTEGTYRKLITHIINALLGARGFTRSQDDIDRDIDDIISLEIKIAEVFTAKESDKRIYERQYNEYTEQTAAAQFPLFNWQTLLTEVTRYGDNEVKNLVHRSSFIVPETEILKKLGTEITAGKAPFQPRTIANYLSIRLVLAYAQFLQDPNQPSYLNYILSLPSLGRRKDVRRRPVPRRKISDPSVCMEATMNNLQYSNARLFLDAAYPNEKDRNSLRKGVAKMTNSILVAFRGMLDQLNWMDEDTRLEAYKKITKLVKNMAYPDFITDDGLLTNYYAEMETFNEADDLLTMNDKIFRWSMWKVLSRLNRAGYQREHFDLPPGLVNAWYQPELNSLTLPLAILGQPFYDAKWPSSLNYGSLGVIAGHELSHGFDDEGVQWDGEGFLTSWMGTNAYNSFKEMAQCIIDEYSGFKPPGMPNLSGEQTQGENIADNGGIHAAYRAYKNEANLRGQEPRLDDPVFSRFTHDQLFFIGFAQVWCERNDTKYGTLEHDLTNPHSPSIFRVLGTLQNFPAFANAFNCPSNKAYSPTKHCTVWVSEVSDDYGSPKNEITMLGKNSVNTNSEE